MIGQTSQSALSRRRRIASAVLCVAATALLGGLLCATMVRLSPGFAVDEEQLDSRLSAGSQQALRHAHDAERNPVRFYVAYIGRLLRGDLGFSQSLSRPIRELLAERTPATASLMAWGVVGAWILALALAVPPVACRLPRLAVVCALFSGASSAVPAAAVAILLYRFGAPSQWAIALVLFPRLYQFLQNLLRQSYNMPHVLLARAKGVGSHRILLQHVLSPARAQLIALAAVSINMAFGAAVAVEAICDLPGLGQLAWKAALARDLPVLVTLTVVITLMTQVSNLVADFCSPELRSAA